MILKAYPGNTFKLLTIILLFTILICACRSTRRLTEDQALITKLNVKGVDKEFAEQAESYVSADLRPNSWFNLFVYNTFNKKRNKNLGEEPHLLDSSLVEASRLQIEKFLDTKGYFKATVKDSISVKKKKAELTFTAKQGPQFKFKDISFNIPDTIIKRIYDAERPKFTHIKTGERYDEDSLVYERDKIYELLKNKGYYDFVRPYVKVDADTNLGSSQANVRLQINNPTGKNAHRVYVINNTYVNIRPAEATVRNRIPDTVIVDSQYRFLDYSGFFKPQKIADYFFTKKGEIYDLSKVDLTTRRLFELNVFKNIRINFDKVSDSSNKLDTRINISPLKKKANRIDGEFTFNSNIYGANLGLTYQNRNAFGGAELFEIKVRGGLQFFTNKGSTLNGSRLQSRDLQIGSSLSFPRLLTPFRIPVIARNGVPHTRLALSYQILDQNRFYSRKTGVGSITYEWVETPFKLHSLTPASIQYSLGRIDSLVSDSLEATGNGFFLATLRSQVVPSTIYNYTYNLIRLNTLNNFLYFSGSAEVGGNTTALAANALGVKKNNNGQREIFSAPYYQFVRLEADARFYRSLGGQKQFIFRINPGFGYAYGNTTDLPFEKKFFAGGSSGIRAWQARTLGPGNYNRSSLRSDTVRVNLRNLDQLGQMKVEGNAEYRFKILDNFFGSTIKGATFVDFGNIWNIRSQGVPEETVFKLNKIWDQLAIGTGAGLRFDVSFFVFRLDAGFKVKDPQFSPREQWVTKYWFDGSARRAFKENYSRTNNPDRYAITQIQFGIGMPF